MSASHCHNKYTCQPQRVPAFTCSELAVQLSCCTQRSAAPISFGSPLNNLPAHSHYIEHSPFHAKLSCSKADVKVLFSILKRPDSPSPSQQAMSVPHRAVLSKGRCDCVVEVVGLLVRPDLFCGDMRAHDFLAMLMLASPCTLSLAADYC